MAKRRAAPSRRATRRSIDWAAIRREAAKRFGVGLFRPGQRDVIDAALSGRDALGLLPTGGGKSLTYQLPALFLPKAVGGFYPALRASRLDPIEALRFE